MPEAVSLLFEQPKHVMCSTRKQADVITFEIGALGNYLVTPVCSAVIENADVADLSTGNSNTAIRYRWLKGDC